MLQTPWDRGLARFTAVALVALALSLFPQLAAAQPLDEGPIEEGPIEEGPIEEGPIEEGPIEEGPIDEGPIDEGPIDENPEPPETPGEPLGEPGAKGVVGGSDPVQEGVLVPPTLLEQVEAVYPVGAFEAEVEGEVVLEIDIDAEGKVEAARVVKAAGYGFDEAALKAVRQYLFTPATVDGEPVPVRITYKVVFQMQEQVAEPGDGEGPVEGPGEEGEPVVSLQGRLLERGTRLPLVGVLVTVFQGEGAEAIGFEATTDAEGDFAFYDLAPGRWKVNVEAGGYFPVRTSEEVRDGEVVEVIYFVERGSYNPYDVLVEGERLRKEVNRRTITTREIEKIPGTFGDPVKVVQNLPGVARTTLASGDIIVRGSSPEDTRVYAQGAQVPLLFHFGGLRSVIPLGIVENIQFQPGNFPTYYGRAMGGVLNVDLKDLRPEKVGGYVDVNLFDSGFFVEAPVGEDVAIAVGGRRSYIDVLLNAVIPEDAPVNLITAPVYYDGQVLVQWRPSSQHLLKMLVFTSDDQLEAIIRNPKDISVQLDGGRVAAGTNFIRSIFEHTWAPTANFENTLMLSNGREEADINIGSGQFYFESSTYQAQLRDTARWRFSEATTMVAGLDMDWSKTDIDIRLPNTGPPKEGKVEAGQPDLDDVAVISLTDARDRNVAGFMDLELQAIDDLLVVPGLRIDWFESTGQVTLDPRLTARYVVTPEYTVKGGVGVFHQPPTQDELVEGFGNPELTAEWAIHYSLGAEYRPEVYPALLVDATLFYKDMTNLVSLTNETVDGDQVDETYNNEGEGRVYGMELLVRHELANNFFGWISYTLSRSERLDPGESEYRLFDTDQTHIFTILGTYQLPRNWEVGARWRYVSGNPFTPIIGSAYNVDLDLYEPTFGGQNTSRQPAFHQLDLRVDKRWIYDTWTLGAYIDVQNATNRSNAEGLDYNFDYSQVRTQQGLPILPILGVKAEF